MFLRYRNFILMITLLSLAPCASNAATWVDWSRRLTLDTAKTPRTLVVRKLKRIKGLEEKLKQGLQDPLNRSYALDVIAALERTSFIDVLQAQVRSDPDGYVILTLNTLLDSKTYGPVATSYKNLLTDSLDDLSPGATVALVDSLTRWGSPLSMDTVESLLDHSYPEVKLATVSYLGAMVLKFKKTAYLKPMSELMSLSPYQVRLQALYLYDALPGERARLSLLKSCKGDKNPIVQTKCRQFYKKWSGGER